MKFIAVVLAVSLAIALAAVFSLVKLIREIRAEIKSRHANGLWDKALFEKAARKRNSLTSCPHGYVFQPSIFRK